MNIRCHNKNYELLQAGKENKMKNAKRIVSMLLVLLMLACANISAFADSKPTATYQRCASTQTVKRGNTAKLVFSMNSGSYAKRCGIFRARFTMLIYRGNCYTGYGKDVVYSGNFRYALNWSVPRRMATGRYTVLYCTGYRANSCSCWRATPTRYAYITVK